MASDPPLPRYKPNNFSNGYVPGPDDPEQSRETYANGMGKVSMRRAMYGDMAWAHTTIGPMTMRQISEGRHPLWPPHLNDERFFAYARRIDSYERLPAPLVQQRSQSSGKKLEALLEGTVPDVARRVARQDAIGSGVQDRQQATMEARNLRSTLRELNLNVPPRRPLPRHERPPVQSRDRASSYSSTASTLVGSREGFRRENASSEPLRGGQLTGIGMADAVERDDEGEGVDSEDDCYLGSQGGRQMPHSVE